MNLKPRFPVPERILITGGPKVGKTHAYLSIAARCPDSQVYVLDSDRALGRMLMDRDLPNVKVTEVKTWEDFVENTRTVLKTTRPQDWLIVDFGSASWDAVQRWYINKKFKTAAEDHFTAFVVSGKKGNALEGDTDWVVVKRNLAAWMTLIKEANCHVLFTTKAKAIGGRDDAHLKMTYGPVGVRPDGEKTMSHDFHTLVVLGKTRTGDHFMTTVGDRGRALIEKAPLTDFALNYLMTVAGWKPGA